MDGLFSFWRTQLLGTFLSPGSTLSIAALALTLAIAAVVTARYRDVRAKVLLRALFPRRLWRTTSGRADIGWFVFSLFGAGVAFGWALLAMPVVSGWTAAALAPLGTPLVHIPRWLAVSIVTVALFVAYEFAYWLDHWAMHRFRPAWEFHKVHHSAESLSLLTIFRVHPVETIGFYNLVAVVMGVTAGVLTAAFGSAAPASLGGTNVLVMLSAVLITHLQHSHLWLTFGPRWGKWLLGPAHHQIHHSVAPEHHDRNFGNCLTLFDRLFGTFTMPEPQRQAITFGVEADGSDPHSIYAMTARPFVNVVGLCYARIMLTAIECLARASEMDESARRCATLKERAEFRDSAIRWRDLARRALMQDKLPDLPDVGKTESP